MYRKIFFDKVFKNVSKDNNIIFKNFSFLSILKLVNVGVKFLLVAYLVRELGEINYGIYTWSDSVIQFFIIFINFGFNVYGAKYIIENKKSIKIINNYISGIFIIKLFFFILSFIVLYFLSFLDIFSTYSNYLFLLLLMGVGEIFFPIWFFQGIEKLKTATYIIITSRIFLVVSTFLFVKLNEDLIIYIYLIIFSNFLMGFLGVFTLIKYHNFTFVKVSLSFIAKLIKEAYMFFLGMFLSLTFNLMTIFLIGIYYTMDFVSGFDIALKVVLVCIIPFDMLQQALYPTITRNKNKLLLKKMIYLSLIFSTVLFLIIFNFPDFFLKLFGGLEMIEHRETLKVLSLIIPFVALTFILGTCTLVAFGFNKEFNKSLILSSLVYLLIGVILYLTNKINFWNLVYLRVFSDILLVTIRIYYVKKNNIL